MSGSETNRRTSPCTGLLAQPVKGKHVVRLGMGPSNFGCLAGPLRSTPKLPEWLAPRRMFLASRSSTGLPPSRSGASG
jgi:hypothetical protein